MRKRGRPKIYEVQKSAPKIEKEFIDRCKDAQIISEAEHRAALHYRWVYTVRYGLPTPASVNLCDAKGRSILDTDSKHEYAAKYYRYVVPKLSAKRVLNTITNSCVYNLGAISIKDALGELVKITEEFSRYQKGC